MSAQRTGSRIQIGVALALALAAIGGNVSAQSASSDVEAGRKLYMQNGCFACHGTVGQGGERGAGPRIAPEPYPFEAFKAMVRSPREAMPLFDPRFVSDEQLLSIHRYLASIPKGAHRRRASAVCQSCQRLPESSRRLLNIPCCGVSTPDVRLYTMCKDRT